MNHPMTAWCIIAGVLLCAFLLRTILHYYEAEYRCRKHKPSHFLEIGNDKEIFFIPGDADDEDEDFEAADDTDSKI